MADAGILILHDQPSVIPRHYDKRPYMPLILMPDPVWRDERAQCTVSLWRSCVRGNNFCRHCF